MNLITSEAECETIGNTQVSKQSPEKAGSARSLESE